MTKTIVDGYLPRDALTHSVVADIDALRASPIIFMVATPTEPKGAVEATTTMIALHSPPERAWGFDFAGCRGNCPGNPKYRCNKPTDAKYECLTCGWKSKRYGLHEIPFIKQWDSVHPTVFNFAYPPSEMNVGFWKTAEAE